MAHEVLLIIDFGSQYTQLIARRARELHVFSIIVPYDAPLEALANYNVKGTIFSGGPNSVYDERAPKLNPKLIAQNVPVLGICYGMGLLAANNGGTVVPSKIREYGLGTLTSATTSRLIPLAANNSKIWMSRGDHTEKAPDGFTVTAKSGDIICAFENPTKQLYALQFHPEVTHTEFGTEILENFMIRICGFSQDWTPGSFIKQEIAKIRNLVGKDNVVCALSGGVDSSIAATLVDRAIGSQQTCIFVDTGLLRLNEYEEVLDIYTQTGLNVRPIRARTQFLRQLKGVTDPERKRKIIGAEFIKIFEAEARKLSNVSYLVQGTLYPDVIESVSVNGPSVTIKSHHNVGGLPKKMKLKLIEPLRNTFKDEVRLIGRELGLPEAIVTRQAFPGPGLAIRIVGEVTPARIRMTQAADAIVREEIEKLPAVRKDLYQYFAVLLPLKSTGVMGDGRTYEYTVAVKAFHSEDVMTADWARLPYDLLATISSRIVSEVRGINRVVYEITTKPPATIEWE